MPLLAGRTAIVTGGAQGLGFAIAEQFVAEGARVVIGDLDIEVTRSAADRLAGPGVTRGVRCDVTTAGDVDCLVAAAVDQFGSLDIMVNNAGITRDRSLINMSDDEWSSVLRVNLDGAFYTTRAMAPRMREAGHGRIVNITSINGMRGKFGQANYSSAKAGLIGLTKTSARELGPKGITVNAVAPGMVMTEMAKQLPEQYIEKAKEESVVKQLAHPEDIANAVVFLLTDAARFITGEVIRVDGGQYI